LSLLADMLVDNVVLGSLVVDTVSDGHKSF
jgi:hypothetical protein